MRRGEQKTRLYRSTCNIIDNNKIACANRTKGCRRREGKIAKRRIQITLSNVSFCRQCFVCYSLSVPLSVCLSVSWLHLLSLRTYFCVWNNTFVPFSLKCVSQNGFIVLKTFRCCCCFYSRFFFKCLFRVALNWKIELNYSLCENEREECMYTCA